MSMEIVRLSKVTAANSETCVDTVKQDTAVDGTNANGATNTPSSTNEQLNKDQNVES